MLDRRTCRHAAALDINRTRSASGRVETPDLKVPFENDRPAIVTNARPQHAAIFELRDLARFTVEVFRPNILCAAAVRHVVNRAIIFTPHRPTLFGAALADLFIAWRWARAHQPYFTFVDVAVTLAPPL